MHERLLKIGKYDAFHSSFQPIEKRRKACSRDIHIPPSLGTYSTYMGGQAAFTDTSFSTLNSRDPNNVFSILQYGYERNQFPLPAPLINWAHGLSYLTALRINFYSHIVVSLDPISREVLPS